MPLPPVATGTIVQIGLESLVFSQRILMLHYYRCIQASSSVPIDTAIASLLAVLASDGPNSIADPYCSCLPANQTLVGITGQAIYPTRYARQRLIQNQAGAIAGPATVSNIAGTITFYDGFAGRSHTATKHIGTLPPNASTNGLLTTGQKDSLNDLAGQMLQNVVIAGSATWEPVIYHKGGDGPAAKATTMYTWAVGDTVRVMRRRTVGLGI